MQYLYTSSSALSIIVRKYLCDTLPWERLYMQSQEYPRWKSCKDLKQGQANSEGETKEDEADGDASFLYLPSFKRAILACSKHGCRLMSSYKLSMMCSEGFDGSIDGRQRWR